MMLIVDMSSNYYSSCCGNYSTTIVVAIGNRHHCRVLSSDRLFRISERLCDPDPCRFVCKLVGKILGSSHCSRPIFFTF